MMLTELVLPETIELGSINGLISFHPLFIVAIYLLLAAIILLTVLFRKQAGARQALRLGVVRALVWSGLIFAIASELLWSGWLLADYRGFGDLDRNRKPFAIDGEAYQFILECKKQVGNNDYSLLGLSSLEEGAKGYYTRKLEYYMLPARLKAGSKYLVVMFDSSIRYDESRKILVAGDRVVHDAELLYRYSNDAYVLRVRN